MLVLDINLSILPVAGLLAAAFSAGLFFGRKQVSASRKKVGELEREMLRNHAEILQLQKEKADMMKR